MHLTFPSEITLFSSGYAMPISSHIPIRHSSYNIPAPYTIPTDLTLQQNLVFQFSIVAKLGKCHNPKIARSRLGAARTNHLPFCMEWCSFASPGLLGEKDSRSSLGWKKHNSKPSTLLGTLVVQERPPRRSSRHPAKSVQPYFCGSHLWSAKSCQ